MDNENKTPQKEPEEPAAAEESIPVASTAFFGEAQPDFWDENFF